MGMGMGPKNIPEGYPCYSLILHNTSNLNFGVQQVVRPTGHTPEIKHGWEAEEGGSQPPKWVFTFNFRDCGKRKSTTSKSSMNGSWERWLMGCCGGGGQGRLQPARMDICARFWGCVGFGCQEAHKPPKLSICARFWGWSLDCCCCGGQRKSTTPEIEHSHLISRVVEGRWLDSCHCGQRSSTTLEIDSFLEVTSPL